MAPPEQRPLGPSCSPIRAHAGIAVQDRPRWSRAQPTDRTPAIGLIGPGGFARHVLVPAFRTPAPDWSWSRAARPICASGRSRQLGFARFAESPEALISDPSVDAVVIASRHTDHAARAQAALEAGKHVFCEKPLASEQGRAWMPRCWRPAARDACSRSASTAASRPTFGRCAI